MIVARNDKMKGMQEGVICLYDVMPTRDKRGFWKPNGRICIELGRGYFPELKWEDAPIEVELIEKKK